MCDRETYKASLLWIMVAITVIVGIVVALIQSLAVSDDEHSYCERALLDTGLDLGTMPYLLENKYCENAWVDAVVYFKLRMSIASSQQVINKIGRYHEYKGTLSLPQCPVWWKPGTHRLHFVYYKNSYSASPIIIVDIDKEKDVAYVYIAVIPA